MLAQHFVLLGRQRVPPLGIAFLDREVCIGCHVILSAAGAAEAAQRRTEPERGRSDQKPFSTTAHVDQNARHTPKSPLHLGIGGACQAPAAKGTSRTVTVTVLVSSVRWFAPAE
jgi:hypothetical protein